MIQLRSLNKRFKEEQLPIELIKGDGYFYFLYETDTAFKTYSVYVNNLNHLTKERWIEEGKEFFDNVKNIFKIV